MSKKTITMTTSQKSIQNGKKEIESLKNRLDKNIKLAVKDLMNITVETLEKEFDSANLSHYTGKIQKELIGDKGFRVFTEDWVIVFNEFGTGVVGANSPSKLTNQYNYQYDVNNHGESGWWYYKNDSLHHTKGMQGKDMFANTIEKLNSIAKDRFQVAISVSLSDESYQSFRG